MEHHLDDLRDGYVDLVNYVRSYGEKVAVRGLPTRELTNVGIVIESTLTPMLPVATGRVISPTFAAAETLDIISGDCHPDVYDAVAPGWRQVMIDPSDASVYRAAYGPRTHDQLAHMSHQLARYPDSRSMIVTVWRPDDQSWPGDRPCTLSLQFIVRADRLELIVTMRSSDVWLGLPYDAFAFTQLQHSVAKLHNLETGRFALRTGSLHLYERDVAASEKLKVQPLTGGNRPLGVVLPPELQVREWRDVARTARSLFAGRATEKVRRANPWYAERASRWFA